MNSQTLPKKLIGAILAVVFLAGCATPTPTPLSPPPLKPTSPPPPPPTSQPLPSPPSLPAQSIQPSEQPSIFKFVKTVQVTPDERFNMGGFVRVGYVPATDRLVVTFGTQRPPGATGDCADKAWAFKEYTLDMQATGVSGLPFCGQMMDIGSRMVDNDYYLVIMDENAEGAEGWRILKYDAVIWDNALDIFLPLSKNQNPKGNGDPMVAYVNGQLDFSSGYRLDPKEPSQDTLPGSYGTHHQFFSTDLEFLEERILTAPPHIGGSSMVFVDDVYYLVTANLYDGDVLVAKYDKGWNYLGGKTLIRQAHFPTGLVYNGERFYLAYTDTSQRTEPGFFPVFLNIHLAVFDRDWNLLDDIAVTNYSPQDHMQPGRPSVILHGDRLYVSYDVDTCDPVTHQEHMQLQAYVSVYAIAPGTP